MISERRGAVDQTETLDVRRVMLTSLLPLNEILIDFHDRIKSLTRGYGSMDYEHADYRESAMVKLDLLVNGESVDAFSCIDASRQGGGPGTRAGGQAQGSHPAPQQYQVAIQAAIGGKIVARETVSAFRKDVTAKCYGGDITRKRKLLEKQKEGKKRMKAFGTGQHSAGSIYRGVKSMKTWQVTSGKWQDCRCLVHVTRHASTVTSLPPQFVLTLNYQLSTINYDSTLVLFLNRPRGVRAAEARAPFDVRATRCPHATSDRRGGPWR